MARENLHSAERDENLTTNEKASAKFMMQGDWKTRNELIESLKQEGLAPEVLAGSISTLWRKSYKLPLGRAVLLKTFADEFAPDKSTPTEYKPGEPVQSPRTAGDATDSISPTASERVWLKIMYEGELSPTERIERFKEMFSPESFSDAAMSLHKKGYRIPVHNELDDIYYALDEKNKPRKQTSGDKTPVEKKEAPAKSSSDNNKDEELSPAEKIWVEIMTDTTREEAVKKLRKAGFTAEMFSDVSMSIYKKKGYGIPAHAMNDIYADLSKEPITQKDKTWLEELLGKLREDEAPGKAIAGKIKELASKGYAEASAIINFLTGKYPEMADSSEQEVIPSEMKLKGLQFANQGLKELMDQQDKINAESEEKLAELLGEEKISEILGEFRKLYDEYEKRDEARFTPAMQKLALGKSNALATEIEHAIMIAEDYIALAKGVTETGGIGIRGHAGNIHLVGDKTLHKNLQDILVSTFDYKWDTGKGIETSRATLQGAIYKLNEIDKKRASNTIEKSDFSRAEAILGKVWEQLERLERENVVDRFEQYIQNPKQQSTQAPAGSAPPLPFKAILTPADLVAELRRLNKNIEFRIGNPGLDAGASFNIYCSIQNFNIPSQFYVNSSGQLSNKGNPGGTYNIFTVKPIQGNENILLPEKGPAKTPAAPIKTYEELIRALQAANPQADIRMGLRSDSSYGQVFYCNVSPVLLVRPPGVEYNDKWGMNTGSRSSADFVYAKFKSLDQTNEHLTQPTTPSAPGTPTQKKKSTAIPTPIDQLTFLKKQLLRLAFNYDVITGYYNKHIENAADADKPIWQAEKDLFIQSGVKIAKIVEELNKPGADRAAAIAHVQNLQNFHAANQMRSDYGRKWWALDVNTDDLTVSTIGAIEQSKQPIGQSQAQTDKAWAEYFVKYLGGDMTQSQRVVALVNIVRAMGNPGTAAQKAAKTELSEYFALMGIKSCEKFLEYEQKIIKQGGKIA